LLKGQIGELKEFQHALRGLSDEHLDGVISATPVAWQTGLASGKLATILGVIRKRRDRVDHWLQKVLVWMSK
jgi:hypothetical protein